MNSIRVKFTRGEDLKYISHLDMMKLFERAFRRSQIPIAYSQGYNPHPHLVFGLPLSVGVTSESEYADFDFDCDIKADELLSILNNHLPEGIRIIESADRKVKTNIMAAITAAEYNIFVTTELELGMKEIKESIANFMKEENLLVDKQSKGKTKQINIRPMIYSFNISDNTVELTEKVTSFCIKVFLSAGSVANLKPEFVVVAYNEFSGYKTEIVKIHRIGLFVNNGDKMVNPLEYNSFLAL